MDATIQNKNITTKKKCVTLGLKNHTTT